MEKETYKIGRRRKNGALKKLVFTRSHGWRDRVPEAKMQRRGRMTDATARLKQNAHEAVAWQTPLRGKQKLRTTRPRDPRGRVTEATHQKLQKTLIVNSEALFGRNPSPEGIDQRLWSVGMHPFKESRIFSHFPWFRFSWREVLSSLFRIRI